jgi:hypothetical protein
MKKNIKIIITKNNNDNSKIINSCIDDNDNLKIINSYIDNINDDINKKDEKVIYNLQYFINILQYLIKKYIILILLILIIIYFYKKYT